MIENYDCTNSYMECEKIDYLNELTNGNNCFLTIENIEKIEDYSNAFIIAFRGLQLIGNALLIKKYALRSKDKNCQFQYLFENGDLNKITLHLISKLSQIRNDIYYQNPKKLNNLIKKEYSLLKDDILEVKEILISKIENV